MGNGIITKQGVRDNPIILKHFIPASRLHMSYPVMDETEKKRGEFLTVIFPIKREAETPEFFSFTGDHKLQDRVMKHKHLITNRLIKVFQFYISHQMRHGTKK